MRPNSYLQFCLQGKSVIITLRVDFSFHRIKSLLVLQTFRLNIAS